MVKTTIQGLLRKYYGGYVGGTALFRSVVCSHLTKDSIVLDVGAGNGTGFQFDLRDEAKKIVGLDVSDEVALNPFLDEWVKADICDTPFDDCHFDVIYSNYVFEHIERPSAMVEELFRISKPGGVVVVRTPNLWHYTATVSRCTPHWFHTLFRTRLKNARAEDVFPTVYRINTRGRIAEIFKASNFEIDTILMVEREPSYLMWSLPPSFWVWRTNVW